MANPNINQRLNGLEPLSYAGVNAVQPPDFITKNRPPTPNDSKNVLLGTIWLDITGYPIVTPTNQNIWMLVALIGNQATWVNLASSGTVTSVNAGLSISITGTAINPIVNVAGTTNHSVLLGNATGSINSLANGTTGQILTAQTGSDPIWTNSGPSISWVDVTATTQAMAINTGYTANNAALVTLTLPATAAYGSIFYVVGKGTGLWRIAQNAGQTIHFGAVNTTTGTGGSLASTLQYDVVGLVCSIANTDFTVIQSIGDITYV